MPSAGASTPVVAPALLPDGHTYHRTRSARTARGMARALAPGHRRARSTRPEHDHAGSNPTPAAPGHSAAVRTGALLLDLPLDALAVRRPQASGNRAGARPVHSAPRVRALPCDEAVSPLRRRERDREP